MFGFDLHVHSRFSADAADSPEDLIAAAKARGLSGIAITDHDTCESHAYCLQNGLSRPDGLPVDGFLVVPGVEISTLDGHLLCIGITVPDFSSLSASAACEEILSRGGVPVPAHPFDHWRAGIGKHKLDGMRLQVVEGFNAAVSSRKFNEKAAAYAAERGLMIIAGSDAHHASAVGISHTTFHLPELSVDALVATLPEGGIPHGHYLSPKEAFKKHFANFFRKQ